MKRIKILLVILLVLVIQINVKADGTCTNEELARLRNLADKVEFSYDYEWDVLKEIDNVKYYYPVFSIKATNLNKELKVMIEKDYLSSDYREFKNDGTGSGVLGKFNYGQTIDVTIRAYTSNECSGKLISTKKVKLPYFNTNYYEKVCTIYPDFKYCKQFLDEYISNEKFISELNNYKKENNVNSIDNNDNNTNDTTNTLNVSIVIIIAVLTIGLLMIVVWLIRKYQKSKI